MEKYIHVNELVSGSAVYDVDNNRGSLVFERVLVLGLSTLVKYAYDGCQFIDVWVCQDGMVPMSMSDDPTHSYNIDDDNEYDTLRELMDGVPL